eukprot:8865558-Alexandrium_andersonii.AAC.1
MLVGLPRRRLQRAHYVLHPHKPPQDTSEACDAKVPAAAVLDHQGCRRATVVTKSSCLLYTSDAADDM